MPRSRPAPKRRHRLVVNRGGLRGGGGHDEDRAVVLHVVATRADAVKLAPVHAALASRGAFRQSVVYTGQHTDLELTTDVFDDVGLPAPEHVLDAGNDSPVTQLAGPLAAGATLLASLMPAAIVVAGSADSTLGVVLAASKLGVPVARIEAGLRTHEPALGGEVNRTLLDAMADVLFAPSGRASENLLAEGAAGERVRHVGSTAVDSVRNARGRAVGRAVWKRFGTARHGYVLVTLHRPENVDDDERLARIVEALAALASRVPVIFPLHPRTRDRLTLMGDAHRLIGAGVRCTPPLGYVDFLSLQAGAGLVITDSGTVQEESSVLGVPCYTLRAATERTVTVTHGTNTLMDDDDPRDVADLHLAMRPPTPSIISFWDGRAADRIADALVTRYARARAVGA